MVQRLFSFFVKLKEHWPSDSDVKENVAENWLEWRWPSSCMTIHCLQTQELVAKVHGKPWDNLPYSPDLAPNLFQTYLKTRFSSDQ
ncbi:hypothetical protein AVEN_19216-1 [Araneus ventricosus]|uniref:Uncharacterized protein n=1 Tax=Araneus ventricosus TaxID=182803 RepID=A0A4Y2SJW4_ARAVE|nr:hypothetical protein AVEN_19216-1 [Araneus ventricosus]